MPAPKRRYGCQRCCLIWYPIVGNLLVIGCAHCRNVSKKISDPVGDPEYLERQVQRSHAGHKEICGRPIR